VVKDNNDNESYYLENVQLMPVIFTGARESAAASAAAPLIIIDVDASLTEAAERLGYSWICM
jgi:hypothetical protein